MRSATYTIIGFEPSRTMTVSRTRRSRAENLCNGPLRLRTLLCNFEEVYCGWPVICHSMTSKKRARETASAMDLSDEVPKAQQGPVDHVALAQRQRSEFSAQLHQFQSVCAQIRENSEKIVLLKQEGKVLVPQRAPRACHVLVRVMYRRLQRRRSMHCKPNAACCFWS